MSRTRATGGEKAVRITKENIDYLTKRFSPAEDERDPLEVGYILVASFGDDENEFNLLTTSEFVRHFEVTGRKLDNGFMEVVKK